MRGIMSKTGEISTTKFVYFDVGGVLIEDLSSGDKWEKMKQDLGVTSEVDSQFEGLFLKNEKIINVGEKSIETMVPLLKKELDFQFPDNYSMLDDFVNRFKRNESIHLTTKKIKKHYRIGLLTNMYPGMLNLIKERGLLPDVEWDLIIDSSSEGLLKPEKGIFELAQNKASVKAEEILFIENTKGHIDGANKMGWQTFLYNSSNMQESSKQLEELFDQANREDT